MTKTKESGLHPKNDPGKASGPATKKTSVKPKGKEEPDPANIQKNLDRYAEEMEEDAPASGSPEDNP